MSRAVRACSAIVLAAHGAREEGAAHAVVRRHAERLRAAEVADEVEVAFHLGVPGFDDVLDRLAATQVTVVPFMTSAGHFADVVLPEQLRRNRRFDSVRVVRTPPLGTHRGIVPLLAARAATLLRAHALAPRDTAIVVVGHGTRRHAGSRGATLAVADGLRARGAAIDVVAAFLDDEPSLAQVGKAMERRSVLVLPFLIGGGGHALHDVPDVFGERAIVDVPFGTLDAASDLVIDLVRRHGVTRTAARPARARIAAGAVTLVGAGPGDPELLTLRGLRALRAADVVVYDRLVGPALLASARPGAELVDVGKGPGNGTPQDAINALLVSRARAGRNVVRLKGGDPFVFGRGSEELEACRDAGVHCEVVPGITSALAAPAAAGIPVTARGIGRSFAVVTGQRADGEGISPEEVAAFARVDTLVILMGRATLGALARQLIAAGRDAATPAACIASATLPGQRVVQATLGTIAGAADAAGLEAPVVTVIGAVAALADVRPVVAQATLAQVVGA